MRLKPFRALMGNKKTTPQVTGDNVRLIHCRATVSKDAITRESINGVEHIVIRSYTMPDDVVMNDVFYPSEEINKSYKGLDRTLAPVEHPVDENGGFVSAYDPLAIHSNHVGAFNRNPEKDGKRIRVEKVINVQVAKQTDKGKRLLDRIHAIESGKSTDPIHTSTGIYVELEELSKPRTNAAGKQYGFVGRNLVFDHDAILLDSTGAATPADGVGLAVNKRETVDDFDLIEYAANADGMSQTELHMAIDASLADSAFSYDYVCEIFDSEVIFAAKEALFEVPYIVAEDGRVTIVGLPTRVERVVEYRPVTNQNEENPMKDKILNALKEAGIKTDGLDDDALFAAYNTHMAKQSAAADDDGKGTQGSDIDARLNKLTDTVEGLANVLKANTESELAKYADIVGNSEQFPGIDVDAAKAIPLDTLKSMAAHCVDPATGIVPTMNAGGGDEFKPGEMPN